MTRGKHAHRAAVRREAAEQEAEVGTYQRKVRELTAELKKEREAAIAAKQSHTQQLARLYTQIREGTSPQVQLLERETERLREERDHAQRRHKHLHTQWNNIARRLLNHASSEHRMTNIEALEWLVTLADGTEFTIADDTISKSGLANLAKKAPPGVMAAQTGTEARIRGIQRARGERH